MNSFKHLNSNGEGSSTNLEKKKTAEVEDDKEESNDTDIDVEDIESVFDTIETTLEANKLSTYNKIRQTMQQIMGRMESLENRVTMSQVENQFSGSNRVPISTR
ncbi:4128_t:CDS:2 [Diversispora eburnea]|uniref:4128_t:CDS:1 n=1 Tax=Diversispora eburnea TaxID=1213867 RepID=A0A9N9FIJ5_9GLOM|nr:4128_t:CDS:2 [Diversispora eburnea]